MNIFYKMILFPVVFPTGIVCGAVVGVAKTSVALINTVHGAVTGGIKEITERSKEGSVGIIIANAPTDFIGGTIKETGKGLEKVLYSIGETVFHTATGGFEAFSALTAENVINSVEDFEKLIESCRKDGVKKFEFQAKRGLGSQMKAGMDLGSIKMKIDIGFANETTETILIIFE